MKNKIIPQFEPRVRFKYVRHVAKQLASGWLGYGDTSRGVEDIFNKMIYKGRYNRLTTSGTIALMIAIKALNLPEKSTILFPSYTFLAGANAARFLGYNIKLIDIKEDTLCMNPNKIEFTDNVSAVMFVNHNGYVGNDLNEIYSMCFKNNIPLIEDSSQGFGILNCGRVGDISVLSFSVPKLITSGQGGLISTNNINYFQKIEEILDHGGNNWRKTQIHSENGVNFKFNDILSSYLYAQLLDSADIFGNKVRIFNEYRKYIKLIDYDQEYTWMVLYRTKKSTEIIYNLRKNNIQAVRYYRPINENPIYKTNEEFPIAKKVYDEIIYLPSSLKLKNKDIKRICEIINRVENVSSNK